MQGILELEEKTQERADEVKRMAAVHVNFSCPAFKT